MLDPEWPDRSEHGVIVGWIPAENPARAPQCCMSGQTSRRPVRLCARKLHPGLEPRGPSTQHGRVRAILRSARGLLVIIPSVSLYSSGWDASGDPDVGRSRQSLSKFYPSVIGSVYRPPGSPFHPSASGIAHLPSHTARPPPTLQPVSTPRETPSLSPARLSHTIRPTEARRRTACRLRSAHYLPVPCHIIPRTDCAPPPYDL